MYTPDRRYYAFCANGLVKPIMYKCPNTGEEYDQNTQQCQQKCTQVGRLPDPSDCHRYFECYRAGTVLVSQRQTCANGYYFNTISKGCTIGSCQTTPPTTTTTSTTTTSTTTITPSITDDLSTSTPTP